MESYSSWLMGGGVHIALLLPHFLHQLADARGDLLAALMAELDGGQHFGFAGLLGPGFNHHDAFVGAGHNDIDLGSFGLLVGRDWRSGCRPPCPREPRPARARTECRKSPATRPPRSIANVEGSRRGSADKTMPITCVSCEYPSGNSGRMGRSINRQVNVSFSLCRPSRLIKPPGKTPRRVRILSVIHGEREEAGSGLGVVRRTGCHQDYRFTGAHNYGAIGLLGHLSGFERNCTPPPRSTSTECNMF